MNEVEEQIQWIFDLFESIKGFDELEPIMDNAGYDRGQVWVFKAIYGKVFEKSQNVGERKELFLCEMEEFSASVRNALDRTPKKSH